MIRGAIELVQDRVIGGWIYSAHASLRDDLVLAFSGERCVGSGKVEIYRPDLAEAGLGDGWSGFHFPIELLTAEHPASIVIRLANCDAALIQPGSAVGPG